MQMQVNGVDMHYGDSGSGEPLLLLHGFTGCGRNWAHVFDLDELARSCRVITPDLRGHGRSTNPAGVLTHRQCALDVLALLDRLEIEACGAIGLSLGANTLLHVATSAPGRLNAMVIVAATTHYPDQARAIMRATSAAGPSEEEWRVLREQHEGGDGQIRALWKHMGEFAEDQDDMAFGAAELSRIRTRTLVVNGDRDPLYGLEPSVALYGGIRESALWIIPEGGHGPIFESWRETFARRALEFLKDRP